MLTLLLIVTIVTTAVGANFNITDFFIPSNVPPHQDEVEIECRYDANFTLLNWFKGSREFFRYKPGSTPSTKSFPIIGVGKVELITCGPTACRLKLGALTEDATGLYRCDIERDIPPYKFESRKAFMEVHSHAIRRPIIEGLAEEYGEGEEIRAQCHGALGAKLRWYINGREVEDARGLATLKRNSSRLIFQGIPPTVTVQCAELGNEKFSGSKELKAKWRHLANRDGSAQEQKRSSSYCVHSSVISLICICAFVYIQNRYSLCYS